MSPIPSFHFRRAKLTKVKKEQGRNADSTILSKPGLFK